MKPLFTLALVLLAFTGFAQTTLTNDGGTLAVQSGATLYVAGTVQNNASGTLTSAGIVQLTGDLINAGTLTASGPLLFSGSTDQTLTPGTATVASLTVANTGAAGANRLLLAQDLTVGSLLTLTQGLVRTQVAGGALRTLSLPDGGRVVGETAGQYVQGRLAVARVSVSGSTGSVDFTNGFVLNPNGQNLGAVTVTRTAGLQAPGVSYGQNVGGTTQGIDRVWQVVASQQPSASAPASATVSWVADDDHGFNAATPAQLWRADQASGPWVAQGAAASASARSFTANTTQLGTLTVSNTSQPLPVTLVSFTAQAQGADALLRWTTASEVNNAYFQVESSVDGITFRPLGQVAGQGTTSQAHTYQFTDAALARYGAPLVYYRLRQVDANGQATYSPVRTVQVSLEAGLLAQAYPNPSALTADITLSLRTDLAGETQLSLTDAIGRQLGQQTVVLQPGTTTLPLEAAPRLAAGVYVLRVRQGARQQVLKLVRQ
ncbi:MAG: T9SS type A sorting domain-containing protein [Cytophagaceae bacterium]|nr:MAG: T9SS type A sorting domain-containing protein [Cytophagaceae bacterium]